MLIVCSVDVLPPTVREDQEVMENRLCDMADLVNGLLKDKVWSKPDGGRAFSLLSRPFPPAHEIHDHHTMLCLLE